MQQTSVHAQSGSEKCVVRLLDLYLSKLPSNPPAIYVKLLDKVPVDSGKPLYCRSRVEVQRPTWAFWRGRIRCTVHQSLNWVYAKGVPEKLNAESSGQKSLNALCTYEGTSSVQKKSSWWVYTVGKAVWQDSIKEEKPFVLLWNPGKIAGVPEEVQKTA